VDAGATTVRATAVAAGGTLVVWTPTSDDDAHRVTTQNLTDVEEHAVPGGRILTARVVTAGAYRLAVGPLLGTDVTTPTTTPTTTDTTPTGTSPAPPADAVDATPTYTG
jgi:hypothetical protein